MLLEEIKDYKIYLASQSPRRRELLAGMGFNFEVMPTHVKEVHPEGCTPAQLVEHLSRLKLSAVKLEDFPENALFIACDTVVVLDDEVLEKPENEDDAFRMLRSLSGREHVVMSGVTVKTRRYCATRHSETRVRFRTFSDDELWYYIRHYRPFDKAGAYGIQEWIGYVGMVGMDGSFYNVMGLPTDVVWDMLQDAVKE